MTTSSGNSAGDLVAQDAPETAFRFLKAVEESVGQLLRMPNVGAPKVLRNRALGGLRAWPVEGFEDMRIYYLLQGETVKVVRILHGKRDINRILEGEAADEDVGQ